MVCHLQNDGSGVCMCRSSFAEQRHQVSKLAEAITVTILIVQGRQWLVREVSHFSWIPETGNGAALYEPGPDSGPRGHS